MENKLLDALNAAKTGNTLPLFQWKENTICEKMIADIKGILEKQRELCAESAYVTNNNIQDCCMDSDNFEVNQESILNAKLI